MDLVRDDLLDRLISVVAKGIQGLVPQFSFSPITTLWLNDVSVFLQAWFPGQEAGHSIAEVVFGSACPGKLPVTFSKGLSDTPAFNSFPGNLEVDHLEVDHLDTTVSRKRLCFLSA